MTAQQAGSRCQKLLRSAAAQEVGSLLLSNRRACHRSNEKHKGPSVAVQRLSPLSTSRARANKRSGEWSRLMSFAGSTGAGRPHCFFALRFGKSVETWSDSSRRPRQRGIRHAVARQLRMTGRSQVAFLQKSGLLQPVARLSLRDPSLRARAFAGRASGGAQVPCLEPPAGVVRGQSQLRFSGDGPIRSSRIPKRGRRQQNGRRHPG